MIRVAAKKSQLFQDFHIPIEDGAYLAAKAMFPRQNIEPQRVILMVPLVGAALGQWLVTFRSFAKFGSIMVNFEYRGHPNSTGRFELDKTIDDARHAMLWAADFADQLKLPLHAFAVCYGVFPVLAQFGPNGLGPGLLKSINTVSGLFRTDQILRFENFVPVFARHLGRPLSLEELLAGIAENRFDWDGDTFRGALHEYLSGLFPELRIGRDYFEDLHYPCTNIQKTLNQLAHAHYLDNISIPPDIPCNIYYGRMDNLLDLHLEEGRRAYRERVLSLIPHANVVEGEYDHYGQGPGHNDVINGLAGDIARADHRVIPAHHLSHTREFRKIPR
jgi:hypothetical protein